MTSTGVCTQLLAFCISFCSLASWHYAAAQRSTPNELRLDNLYPGEAVQAFDLRPRTMKGSLYYAEEPMPAAIKLMNGKTMSGYEVLYNLESDLLEILKEQEVYALPGDMIAEFTLAETAEGVSPSRLTRFVRTSTLPGGEHFPRTGFLKFEVSGELNLLTGYEVEIVEPNYVPALDAGSLQAKAVQKERFFLYDGEILRQIPPKKKEATKFFDLYYPEASRLAGSSGLSLRDGGDLVRLLELVNQR